MKTNNNINGINAAMIVVFALAGIVFFLNGCDQMITGGSNAEMTDVFFGFALIGFAWLFILVEKKDRN